MLKSSTLEGRHRIAITNFGGGATEPQNSCPETMSTLGWAHDPPLDCAKCVDVASAGIPIFVP